MSIRIVDCTIRDGGYLLEKNTPSEVVSGIINGLIESGIDFVEIGFLQTSVTGETLVYRDMEDAERHLPSQKGKSDFLGFCDNSRYSIDQLNDYREGSIKWLRISFAKHEMESALQFCEKAKNKGYKIQFNPMDAISYTDDEREYLIKKVNGIMPSVLSIVDTFGAMYIEDLKHIFNQLDQMLDSGIGIGLHSHDNLGLSNALAEVMCSLAEETHRDVMIDGSLFGMGRGAGNANTELLADYLNKYHGKSYNIEALIKTIEHYVLPIKKSGVEWGYDLLMYVCGILHAHVDNVYHMQKKGIDVESMYHILDQLSVDQRTRYGKNYSKADFSVLDSATDKYNHRRG